MKAILLAAAALALCAGAAQSAPKAAAPRANALVGPEQPIPYARVQAYSKASAKARANTDWWTGQAFAQTGVSADVSAKAPTRAPARPPR